jgi:predicted Zn finger-like uncharacterized protein
MPIIVACPACGGKLRVADDLLGQRVRCPACKDTFDAARPPAPPPLNLSLDDEPAQPPPAGAGLVGAVELNPPPADVPAAAPPRPAPAPPDERRECPACGRHVARDLRRCLHCGERLAGGRGLDDLPELTIREPVRRDCEPHRGPLVLTLGVLSLVMLTVCYPVGVALGLVAWVMGQADLRKIRAGNMDPAGQGLTQAGWICGIVGTALNALITLACAGMFGLVWYQERRPRPRPTPPPAWQKGQQKKWVNPPDDGP